MNLPDNPSFYINQLPVTNDEIDFFVNKYVNELENSGENALKVAVQLKAMEKIIEKLRTNNRVRNLIMDEVDKYHEKIIEFRGAKIEKALTGVKYDFKNCQDSKYDELKTTCDRWDKSLKKRETFLKSLQEPIVIEDTGEVINPPVKTGNEYVKITLK